MGNIDKVWDVIFKAEHNNAAVLKMFKAVFTGDFMESVDPMFRDPFLRTKARIKTHLILNYDDYAELFEEMPEHPLISDIMHTTLYLDIMTTDLIDSFNSGGYSLTWNKLLTRHKWKINKDMELRRKITRN